MGSGAAHTPRPLLPALPCACANLRRAARAVSRLYNRELRPAGIEITQFTLLMALDAAGPQPQGKLGGLLALDSTTLTRMLEPLRRRGWVRALEGKDRRLRIFTLTAAGRAKLRQASRRWERAQQRLAASLGEPAMSRLALLLTDVASALG